jgi:hypothetical protein
MSVKETTYGDIKPRNYDWLWSDVIVKNEATLLVGDSGVGKGFLVADIVAAITTGRSLPRDRRERNAASVILVSLEEDPECTTSHKLNAAGANPYLVHDLSETDSPSEHDTSNNRGFVLQEDSKALKEYVGACNLRAATMRQPEREIALVVLDPLSAMTDRSLSSTKAARDLMNDLRALARDLGTAVLVVHHPVKGRSSATGTGLSKKDRVGGSKALTDAARLVLDLVKDSQSGERVLSILKSNISDAEMTPLRFQVAEDWPDMHVEWIEELEADTTDDTTGEPAPGTVAYKVLTTLREYGEPMTPSVLGALAEVKCGTVRSALGRLCDAGLVAGLARGVYVATMYGVVRAETDVRAETPVEPGETAAA